MRKKILLVDDTITVTTLEKIILGERYDYVEARNGEEAFRRAVEERPDLILMDLNMPVRNGLDGLKALKTAPETAAIPVVIVTTQAEEAIEAHCRELGCDAFVSKPIDKERLLATVRKLLGPGE